MLDLCINTLKMFEKTNYSSTDILIFSETRFSPLDPDEMYNIDGYRLFRNDISNYTGSRRPYGGTAVYS